MKIVLAVPVHAQNHWYLLITTQNIFLMAKPDYKTENMLTSLNCLPIGIHFKCSVVTIMNQILDIK